ncbi:excalibur calcium-binding domain-containing protein [Streptomyces sp. A13(2022)]|uniref:excalibur calcium-binding domain-containing protein n=1 Tax=Streptomyces sp. A13(2022) TaxID=2964768 RepID=UPI0021DAB9CF|nr:excalibur calcium-binding domain-containing protein [Streptomyces sp. A13(2022)]MCU8589162.1 excalibur calcium-binding domain-containing protein [Streptomyces sp. A13(2022)]
MNLIRKPAAVAVAALALAALPTAAAQAHDGAHPFKNCSEAYAAGYSNIKEGTEHYGDHLDRDRDGLGCDNPPADFVPAGDKGGSDKEAGQGSAGDKSGGDQAAGAQGTDLAETGGNDNTPYIAAAGGAVVLAGGGLLLAARRRRSNGAG